MRRGSHVIGTPSPEIVEAFQEGAARNLETHDLENDVCMRCGLSREEAQMRRCDPRGMFARGVPPRPEPKKGFDPAPEEVVLPSALPEGFVPADLTASPDKVENIPVELCRPSPYNPREFAKRPSEKLIDLAKSIRRTTQVQAATVRPMKLGPPDPKTGDITTSVAIQPGEVWTREEVVFFEIVAGERRWRAASLRSTDKGLTPDQARELDEAGAPPAFLRAEIRLLTDEQAMEVCAVENLDREDLLPMEEAKGVQTLMALYKGDVEAVAARLNRGTDWVAARVRITKLSPKWRKALSDPERGFQGWTAGHLAHIAKLEPAAQDALLENLHSPQRMTVNHVKGLVCNEVKLLGGAPFDTADPLLVAKCGPCTTCPATSLHTPGLFTDMGDDIQPADLSKARCLNPVCWKGKVIASATGQIAKLRKQHGDAAIVYDTWDEGRALPEQVQQRARRVEQWQFKKVEPGTKGAFPGVYAVGPKAGQVQWFKKEEMTSYGTSKPTPAGPKPLKDRRADLTRRRKKAAVEKIAELVTASESVPGFEVLMALAASFGTKVRKDNLSNYGYYEADGQDNKDPWRQLDKLLQVDDAARSAAVWAQVRPVLLSRLTYTGSGCDVDKLYANAKRIGELVKVDAKAALDEATAAIKEPKAWASLKEDGTPKTAAAAPANGKKKEKATPAKPAKKTAARKTRAVAATA